MKFRRSSLFSFPFSHSTTPVHLGELAKARSVTGKVEDSLEHSHQIAGNTSNTIRIISQESSLAQEEHISASVRLIIKVDERARGVV